MVVLKNILLVEDLNIIYLINIKKILSFTKPNAGNGNILKESKYKYNFFQKILKTQFMMFLIMKN